MERRWREEGGEELKIIGFRELARGKALDAAACPSR